MEKKLNIWVIVSIVLIGIVVLESGMLIYNSVKDKDVVDYKQHYIDYCEINNAGIVLINTQAKLLNLYGYNYKTDWEQFDCSFW